MAAASSNSTRDVVARPWETLNIFCPSDLRLGSNLHSRAWIEIRKRSRKVPINLQQAIEAGERLALDYLGEVGREIGHRLSGLIDLIDPEVVIFGGEAVRFGPALIEPLVATVRETSFATPPPIEIDWDNNVWSRGASALAIQQFFDFESTAGFEREGGTRPSRGFPAGRRGAG